jgi:hypothetical protein
VGGGEGGRFDPMERDVYLAFDWVGGEWKARVIESMLHSLGWCVCVCGRG